MSSISLDTMRRKPRVLSFLYWASFTSSARRTGAVTENGAYIYRRFKNHGIEVEDIAREIALSASKVRQMITAFQMMIDAEDDNTSRWSYYEAYASSNKLKKQRENVPEFP